MVIYLGIPMYGGAHGLTVSCLLASQKRLMEMGHTVITDIVADGSILTKVRNGIVKRFLDSPADVLVSIDSDMCWEPETLQKLVEAPFDISVANYRAKNTRVIWMAQSMGVGVCHEGDDWHQTHRAGTGMMVIKRETITGMIEALPHLQYEDRGVVYPCLFDFELSNGQYHGEDYTFCRRAESIGKEIYILADAFMGHIGTTVYGGNYSEHIRG